MTEYSKYSILSRALKVILDVADACGISRDRICADLNLNYAQLSIPDGTVSVSEYYALVEYIRQNSNSANLGLYVGRVNYLESMHLSLYMASAGRTLRDWLNMMPSVASLFGDIGSVKVRRKGDQFSLCWHPNEKPNPQRCLITDSMIAASVLQMGSFCIVPVKPVRIDLSYPQPADTSVMKSMLGGELYFNQPISRIHYQSKALDYPLVHVTTNIYEGVSEEFAVFFSDQSSHADPFLLALHAAILRQLPRGQCCIESVAKDLCLSRRTLQRRLEDRRTNFQKLLQGIKSTMSKKYLDDEGLSIIEIAFLLGYSDHSTFSAAFKNWYSVTPSEYRRQAISLGL